MEGRLHKHRGDCVLDVAIGGTAQQFPKAALCQLGWAFSLLLTGLQRGGRATAEETEREGGFLFSALLN